MADLSPEIAGKVLGADLRNLVQKIGGGDTLSTAERELMERYLTLSTPPEELIKARRIALTRKWATGGKLSKEEQKEAGIPDPAPALSRQTSDRYQKPLEHYAKIYGRDKRNIKRWIKDGREASPQDFPPFDEPSAMAAWFRRVKGQEPRENLTRFEREDGDAEPAEKQSLIASGDDDDDDPSPLPAMNLESVAGGVSGDIALQQIQSLVQATFKQMQLALKAQRMKEYKTLFIEYKQLVQVQRSWEKDIVKIQEGRGEVLRTREVNTELVQIFTTLGHSFYNVLLKTIRQFSPQMPYTQQRTLAKSLVDGCYTHAKKTRWASAWQPDAIVIDAAES
jgi:hypothetical protein